MEGKEEQDKKEQTIEVDIRRLEVVDVEKRFLNHFDLQAYSFRSIYILGVRRGTLITTCRTIFLNN